MAKLTYKKRILPDPGKRLFAILSAEEVENRFFDPKVKGSQKTRMEWEFADVDKPDVKIRAWSGTTLTSFKGKKAKALEIAEAALGKELSEQEREELDTDTLIGKRLFLTVKLEKNEDGEIYAKIIDYENSEGLPF